MSKEPFVSGFCAIVGRPNVGKSTLLNAFIERKLAIMSDKPQTTRNRILGVYNRPSAQVVFLDTPGIHKPHHRLGEYMNKVATGTMPGVDVILFVVDGSSPEPGDGDRFVAQAVARSAKPAILVVNKMDTLKRENWYPVMDAYKKLGSQVGGLIEWVDVVPVSAVANKNVEKLLDLIVSRLEEGPRYYPEEMVTDQPEQFVMAEFIREKILELTREEIPHSIAVAVEQTERRDSGVVYVAATIYVERESQKAIIIGNKGSMLRAVGSKARVDIEELLGSRIYLELFVKVREDWRNRMNLLRSLGYREE